MNDNPLHERKAFLEEAGSLLCQGDHLKVLSLAKSRLKRTPGDMDARIAICRVWIEQERLEEAGEMLREMEDILAGLSHIYACMGDIYLRKGMAESAQDFYRTFVNLNPDTPMARKISERIESIAQQHVADEPERKEKEEVATVPDDFRTVTLAELYARQGHLRMAEEILEAILGRGPHHPKAAELLREVRDKIAHQEEPGENPEPVTLREAGESDTHPEEPGAEYAPVFLQEPREEIGSREKPAEKTVAELLREFRERIARQEKPEEEPEPAILRAVGEEAVSREELEAHLEPVTLRGVGGGIAYQEEPGKKRVEELIRELEELREKIAGREKPAVKHEPVIAELSRWLNNIGRPGSHAG